MLKTLLLLSAVAAVSFSTMASADEYVHGYTRKDGTYVQPYYRTNPDNTRDNNYSTRGNVNPYTGQPGTKPGDEYRDSGSSYSNPYAPGPTYQNPYEQPRSNNDQDPNENPY